MGVVHDSVLGSRSIMVYCFYIKPLLVRTANDGALDGINVPMFSNATCQDELYNASWIGDCDDALLERGCFWDRSTRMHQQWFEEQTCRSCDRYRRGGFDAICMRVWGTCTAGL